MRPAVIETAPESWQDPVLPLNYGREIFPMPGPRVELGTPASSGQRSTAELTRHEDSL